jgi:hypothetical protein
MIMAGLGLAVHRLRRSNRTRSLTALKWSAIIITPFWLVGLGFGGLTLVSRIREHISAAEHYFTLDKAAEVDGIDLPAGTRVELDTDKALKTAELPDGATVTLHGATWRGRVEFATPAHTPNATHGAITDGTLAASAVIDDVPCRAGGRVTFFWNGALMECTLSQDADLSASIAKPDGATQARQLRCIAGDTIEMAGLRRGEVEACRLAKPVDFGEVSCAEQERIRVTNGTLSACTFRKPAPFGPLVLPTGTRVTYYDGYPSAFALPPQSTSVDAFGLSLPPGTEGSFCDHKEALEHLSVSRTVYVVIEGVKLSGWIDFECGSFRSGLLFEDTIVGGRWRQHDERVSREDLSPPEGG